MIKILTWISVAAGAALFAAYVHQQGKRPLFDRSVVADPEGALRHIDFPGKAS